MPDSHVPAADEAATRALAAKLAARARPGDVILLAGPLGAGKTAFARAFIRASLGDMTLEVPSPSFTLVQTYESPTAAIWHYDLWRLPETAGAAGLAELAWDEAQSGIVLVEWPDRLGPLAPPAALRIEIALSPTGRHITLSGPEKWFDAP